MSVKSKKEESNFFERQRNAEKSQIPDSETAESIEKHDVETPELTRKSSRPILIKVRSGEDDTNGLLDMEENDELDEPPERAPARGDNLPEKRDDKAMEVSKVGQNDTEKHPRDQGEENTEKIHSNGMELIFNNNNTESSEKVDRSKITPIENVDRPEQTGESGIPSPIQVQTGKAEEDCNAITPIEHVEPPEQAGEAVIPSPIQVHTGKEDVETPEETDEAVIPSPIQVQIGKDDTNLEVNEGQKVDVPNEKSPEMQEDFIQKNPEKGDNSALESDDKGDKSVNVTSDTGDNSTPITVQKVVDNGDLDTVKPEQNGSEKPLTGKDESKKEDAERVQNNGNDVKFENNNAKSLVDDDAITPIDDDHDVAVDIEGTDKPSNKDKADGKDKMDAVSVVSLFMERDPRFYFQHPYLRLFLAYFVTFCNFLIYAEDPVAHSMKECNIPLIGNDFAFVFTRYPANGFSFLKIIMWLGGIVIGCILGKILIHTLVLNKILRLKMFTRDKGSWMIMFLCSLLSLFVVSWIYNGFLIAGGDDTEQYRISGDLGLSNSIFMKAAACGTWSGDFFTAWMVTDMMLQERLYPGWAKIVRTWWNRRYNRIILFWVVTLVTSFIVIFLISTDYIQWDKLNRGFLPTNEVSRSFLASFILVMDIMIVCQDWDFPHFMSAIDIKMPGVNTAYISFEIPKCLKKESWNVHITGKWFNYGILFIVMLLDLNMWKNQMFYKPFDYGQYTDSEGRIHTVLDDYSLNTFNESLFTWSYRNETINPLTNETYLDGDLVISTRFYDYSLPIKGIAFIPALVAFIVFGLSVWIFGRFKPTKDDPYGGRLKKRKKKGRFSFRNISSSFRKMELRRKVQAVPKLLRFKRKQSRNTEAGNPENGSAPGDITLK